MASWMDAPPTKEELKSAPSWADAPPTKEELAGLESKPVAPPQSPGLLNRLGSAIKAPVSAAMDLLGEKYDSYVKAPARAGVSKLQEGDIPGSVEAWYDQLGKDPKTAPTGKSQALAAGASDEKIDKPQWLAEHEKKIAEAFKDNPDMVQRLAGDKPGDPKFNSSNADVYGRLLELAEDPGQILPVERGLGLLYKGTKAVGRGTVNALKAAEAEKLGTTVLEEAPKMYEPTPKPNIDQIKEAAQRLKTEPTPGMLTDNYNLQRLEDTLAQSPTIAGNKVRAQRKALFDALDESAKGVGEKPTLTPNEAGKEIQKGLMSRIHEKLDPLKASYEEIQQSTNAAPITEQMSKKAADRLRMSQIAKGEGLEANQLINSYAESLEKATDVQTVQNIISDAKAKLRNGATGPSRIALQNVVDSGDRLLRRGLLTAGKESAGAAGTTQAKGLLKQIKETNKAYGQLSKEVQGATGSKGMKGSGPTDILNQVDKMKPEQVAAAFDLTNVDKLRALKQFSPESFEIARQQRIGQLLDTHMLGGKINLNALAKTVNKLPRDVQELLFPQGFPETAKDIKVLLDSMPKNFNPSGTASQIKWYERAKNIPNEVSDYMKYRKLHNMPNPDVGGGLYKTGKGLIRAGRVGAATRDTRQ